ncbi:hypothetical protein [Succinivibrio dextrinosolvens]|jgi:hypothetical protein|uniref:hypothetical protein n=1 Tax=Succinivibrio dextrinosolvens TaxID=83771 RepID=UPI00241EA813|nr:hypothetical protein [Succinivibrio dextrinosolvens]MBE6423672.1 DUF2802 domain-containing protein [Succinivibrio dextrinosolvens]
MQSYLDVTLIAAISTAVVLLLFILISFVITSRRCTALEKENLLLKASVDNALKSLEEQASKYTTSIEALERKMKASDMSLQYLTSSQQDIVDKQKVINTSFDNLSVKVEQQKKEIQNNSVENQPIILAKRLLAEGLSVEEVIAKTNLPQYEVEMLAKVHNLSAKVAAAEIAAKAKAADNQTPSLDKVKTAPAASAPAAETPKTTPAQAAATAPHVASLKAREAYGMGAKTGLRRPR